MTAPEPGQLLRGSDIKCKLWKVLRRDMTHYGFTYTVGLNVLEGKFNPSGQCSAGGLYVTWQPPRFYDFGSQIAEVQLPPDAMVWTEFNKLKVDKLILGTPMPIKSFQFDWLEAVKMDPSIIDLYDGGDEKVHTEALKRDPRVICSILCPSKIECLTAVRRCGATLQWIESRFRTPEICLAAVEEDPEALKYVGSGDMAAIGKLALEKKSPVANLFCGIKT